MGKYAISQCEFMKSGAIMRIKQSIWVLTALLVAGVPCARAQTGAIIGTTEGQHETAPTFVPNMLKQAEIQGQLRPEDRNNGLSLQTVLKDIKKSSEDDVIKEVMNKGVDFEMNAGIERKLHKANATGPEIEAVRQAGPKVRERMAKLILPAGEGGFKAIPKEEARAFDVIKVESDPDREIALVDDFAKKYPDSTVLSYVYSLGASVYLDKSDIEKVVEYSEKSLKLKPDNLTSLILHLGILPMTQYVNAHQADREKILDEAVSEANQALQLIPKIPRKTGETDAYFQRRQNELASEAHGALGMVHLNMAAQALQGPDKDELAKAEQEFTAAVTLSGNPDPRNYFRLGDAYKMDGKWAEAIQAFTKAGELGQGTVIKAYADEEIAALKKKKA